ncbi:MAG TPA: MOSC domain-containing protein [Anaerolineales bacterium]|nr:MOSC domain-containing protein [Anaerolineales bacterium]
MEAVKHLSMTELEAGMEYICQSPRDHGVVKMIARRPRDDEREVVHEAELDVQQGLIGDNWKTRGSKHMPDGSANPNAQITVMNARTIELLAQAQERWPLAGDQLYIDMELSDDNLPPGTRLSIGSAILEVSAQPHTGCRKFSDRFGVEATKFVNSPEGKRLQLRGINTRVLRAGVIRVGDVVRKIDGTIRQEN